MQAIELDPYKEPHNRFGRRIQFSRLPRFHKQAIRADAKADRLFRMSGQRIQNAQERVLRNAEKHAANLKRISGGGRS